jgi:HD-like signal output (HDOD) protein
MRCSPYVVFAEDVYSLPPIAVQLRALLDDTSTDVADIAMLLSIDPMLTSQLLGLVNSPLFCLTDYIDNIARAISVIGGEAIYHLVIAQTAKQAMLAHSNDCIDSKRHWHKSVLTGLLAKRLAKSHVQGLERFFLLGILYHLGEMVVARHTPVLYSQYSMEQQCVEPWEKQIVVFGFDFALCSGAILKAWGLHEPFFAPLMNVHDLSQTHKPLAEKLLCQAQAIQWCLVDCVQPEQSFNKSSSLVELSLEYNELKALYALANHEADDIATLF